MDHHTDVSASHEDQISGGGRQKEDYAEMMALILNSGIGSRMGSLTANKPKCMVEILDSVPLVRHQVSVLRRAGITDFVMTTGYQHEMLEAYLQSSFDSDISISFVRNPDYTTTNYIYSMYLALGNVHSDLVITHGDLYFGKETVSQMLSLAHSSVVVDSTLPLPLKDFKAQISGGRVTKIATYISGTSCMACQPLYRMTSSDWRTWSSAIGQFCDGGRTNVYAEEALNSVLGSLDLRPFDVHGTVCMEVDTLEDLDQLRSRISEEGDRA